VAWAFISVLVTEGVEGDSDAPSRLVALGLLTIYLFVDWALVDAMQLGGTLRRYYWIGDASAAAAIAAFAIMTALPHQQPAYALAALFVIAILSHLAGIWRPIGESWFPGSPVMAGVHFTSLIILLLSVRFSFQWGLATSFFVALAGYLVWSRTEVLKGCAPRG
jgi:hypothetical protein